MKIFIKIFALISIFLTFTFSVIILLFFGVDKLVYILDKLTDKLY